MSEDGAFLSSCHRVGEMMELSHLIGPSSSLTDMQVNLYPLIYRFPFNTVLRGI